jgi:C-terminal processing protease CtpA/Prc
LLELADAFSQRQLGRSFLFIAFSGEEEGLLGSKYYVNHPVFPLEKTIAMINMDMIGRMKDRRLIIGGAGSSPFWRELLNRINQEAKFDLKFQEDGFGPSDHSSFYAKDIPVLFFFTGVHQDYHKPSDDFDKIETQAEEKVLQFIYQAASELNTANTRPLFTKSKEPGPQQTRGGFRVYLGTIPDYGEEVEGVKLSGVREGSPAEKAGLKGGDVIVECAGKKVKNIYDFTFILQEHKVGDVIEIIVQRDSQRLRFSATLGTRD